MDLKFASCLLIVCGIVDATFYNQRGQSFNQLNERRQRSIGLPYAYGYHYNPIEPSMDMIDSLSETFDYSPDSKINTYKPTYQHVKMSTFDTNTVLKTHSHHPKDSLYDSEYISVQDIPRLVPEDNYDYKYLASPSDKYQTRPLTAENDIAINILAVKNIPVYDFGLPIYKSPYLSKSVLNFGSKIPNSISEDFQSVETNPEISKISSPTVIIVELLPETLKQESIPTTTENAFDIIFKELLMKRQNAVKKSTKGESNSIITEETPTENESSFITTEQNPTEGDSTSVTTEETLTEEESNSIITEETKTETESSFITTEQNPTENESKSIATEETPTEDKSNSITTEETPIEDDESKPTTTQEMITDSNQHNELVDNWYLKPTVDRELKIKKMLNRFNKLKNQIKPLYMTVDNISAEFPSNLESGENTNQQLQPKFNEEFFFTSEEN